MKVVSYNIQYCKGRDDKIDPQRVVDSVREADIIAFQEVDKAATENHYPSKVVERTML
jgi:endonuclease/exonuclease/phosphatase family metal-dependent hydrolase